ncbi:MAG: hypothetical protein AAF649_10225 [Verrucomicrobiota bacterium]
MGNYWSSGGRLRSREIFEYLNIPLHERLLAAVFVEYPPLNDADQDLVTRKPGALRNRRSDQWIRTVDLDC